MNSYSTAVAAQRAGVSARQADYWIRKGYMFASQEADGSGSARRWSDADVEALRIMGLLVRVSQLPLLAQVARAIAEDRPGDAQAVVLRVLGQGPDAVQVAEALGPALDRLRALLPA